MKVALIPPTPELLLYGHSDFHLLLSHLLKDPDYFVHYEHQRERGAYLILDNSAHEFKEGDDPEALLFNAVAIRAQEVVVPDVLDDGPATVERAIQALEVWFEGTSRVNNRVIHDLSPTLMYVPQGKSEKDWGCCLRDLVQMHKYVARKYEYKPAFVIGLSKDYETWEGGLLHLLDKYLFPLYEQNKRTMNVHLLGWGRKLWELNRIAQYHPWVRSTDSAKPFVFAMGGINLYHHLDSTPPKYPGRTADYFTMKLKRKEHVLAEQNIQLFQENAEGRAYR